MKRFLLICFLVFISLQASLVKAQDVWTYQVQWKEAAKALKNEKEIILPVAEMGGFEGNKFQIQGTYPLKKGLLYNLSVSSVITQDLDAADQTYLQMEKLNVPTTLDINLSQKMSRGEPFAVAVFFPYLMQDGKIKKVKEVQIKIDHVGKVKEVSPKSFAANSVLKNGTFYRIEVTTDAIYKIDEAFLKSVGISTTNLNPNHIHIFGNGDGLLSEDNAEKRTDDLASNAIFVRGDSDGIFNSDDYILFYGYGPHRWKSNSSSDFSRIQHIYSDVSYYYIHISSNLVPNRIENLPAESLTPNKTITNFDGRAHYEVDTKNLVSGGQRWYGDIFDDQLSRTFNFTFPEIVAGATGSLRYAFACNAVNGSNLNIQAGSTTLVNQNIGSGGDFSRAEARVNGTFNNSNIPITINFTKANPSVTGYLDYLTLTVKQNLKLYGTEVPFRSFESVGAGNISEFTLSNANSQVLVWDITDRHTPRKVNTSLLGTDLKFVLKTDSLREFVAFYGTNFSVPKSSGTIGNQNLHGLPQADYIIVSHPDFIQEANRLADLHRSTGLEVHVVTPQAVYNEFSSGMQDATAIRQFLRMFYKRGLANNTKLPKYLLLFGDGIYDPKGRIGGGNFCLTYQVKNSETYIDALVSDDFFGFLDDNESFANSDMLDIGVGRLLISSQTIAKEQVDKVEHYLKNGSNYFSEAGDCDCPTPNTLQTFGDWRTRYLQIADDEEYGYFINQDIEPQINIVNSRRPEMNADKIYLDAYQQISNAGGQRYPEAVNAINDRIRRGVLVLNYVGHGGEVGVAEERVITVPQILDWKNSNALPLMVTATCEFTKYDDPNRVSAGEWASLNPKGGAIALMTTTRSVYFSVNSETGKSFFKQVFLRDADSLPKTFGEIIMNAKNGLGSIIDNKRSFTLIGDPALRLAMPRLVLKMDSMFREGSTNALDTVRALDKITLVGHVEDFQGNLLNTFQGVASPTIFDKGKTFYTLGQDNSSPVIPYQLQKNALYKGKATIKDGRFKMTFVVPKDIDYSFGKGRVSLYGNNASMDGFGVNKNVVVGGVNPNGIQDEIGPSLELFMNDENFVDGGLTNETPLFLAKIKDENGINAVGNGIGHDITLVLDGKTDNPYVLNEYYQANLDDYQAGKVEFLLPKIEPGEHTATFKIWDVNNNSSESTIRFVVKEEEKPELAHVLNYPNPFTTKTEFFFEHNQINSNLETQIQIFTISGRLVKTINQLVSTQGFRSNGISWDGRDDFGDPLAKGVYVYRLSIRTENGDTAEKLEKLVILK